MNIAGRAIGPREFMFVVAELSCNHAGSLARAMKLVSVAAKAGADAIKLQTFRPKELAALRGGGQAPPPWDAYTLEQLYEVAQTPWDWHADLFAAAKDAGLIAFSSTFSAEATAFLLNLGVPALKVSAFEWERRAELGLPKGFPVICSCRPNAPTPDGCDPNVALLYCPPGYPASPRAMGLRDGLARLGLYSATVGLSDHSLSTQTPIVARALWASILEVHLMLDDADYHGALPLDAGHSWRPAAFTQLVQSIRHAELTL